MDLIDFKTTFDGVLQEYVDEKIRQSTKLLDSVRINSFVQYIQNFIFSEGKRIRPYVLRAVYMGLGGGKEKEILHIGIIFELFHTMALIHDDIMDCADKRHNVMTMHKFIESQLHNVENAQHVGESQAILIGDLVLARVYELRYKINGFEAVAMDKAKINIHEMIEDVILGQMIDVDMEVSGPASLDLIDKKNRYKTASYTFVRPMLTGAVLAGANEDVQKQVSELGIHLGLAFQMRDDLMDLTGGDKTKSLFSDVQEWQQTYFTHYVFEHGTDEQKELLKSCLGKRLSDEKIVELKKLFQDTGAIDRGKQQITEHLDKAKVIFEEIPLTNDEAKLSFAHMMRKLENK